MALDTRFPAGMTSSNIIRQSRINQGINEKSMIFEFLLKCFVKVIGDTTA